MPSLRAPPHSHPCPRAGGETEEGGEKLPSKDPQARDAPAWGTASRSGAPTPHSSLHCPPQAAWAQGWWGRGPGRPSHPSGSPETYHPPIHVETQGTPVPTSSLVLGKRCLATFLHEPQSQSLVWGLQGLVTGGPRPSCWGPVVTIQGALGVPGGHCSWALSSCLITMCCLSLAPVTEHGGLAARAAVTPLLPDLETGV